MSGTGGLRARAYRDDDADAWDAFVATTASGNLLHTRRFLAYHGDRFEDRSVVIEDAEGHWRGAVPAAVDPRDPARIVSHPGATYGGLLARADRALDVPAMLALALAHWRSAGFARLLYRSVPVPLHAQPCVVDAHALWHAGAALVRRDLWSVVDLARPRRLASERRRHLRRAADAGLRIVIDDGTRTADFHALLSACLRERHGAAPVHTLEEMRALDAAFPDRIATWLALDARGELLAGEWIFDLGVAWHGQYGAASPAGRAVSAQDRLLEQILDAATAAGRRVFSFGTSTQDEGRVLNAGLFRYKASFGADTAVQDFHALDLAAGASADAR